MMPLFLALLAAQVGPLVTPGAAPALPHERDSTPLRPPPRSRAPSALPAPLPPAQPSCLQGAESAPADAETAARAWLSRAKGAEQALAGECLGVALSAQGRWDEAGAAFITARDVADAKPLLARLGAMAGNAALARGDASAALTALDAAKLDAAGDSAMLGGIAIDRARALVALKRDGEAAMALDEARAIMPGNAQAWLLSATLSRRTNKLVEAQAQIQKAAELLPVDPEIGLEAGVIAVLSGHDEAARKSWQSVLSAAPGSDAANTAKAYLAQLGPVPIASQVAKP